MKWFIAGLFLLGLVAAAAAAVSVVMLRNNFRHTRAGISKNLVQIVVATKPLAAMTVVDGNLVETKMVPAEEAPPRAISGMTQAIGKILSVPMTQSQAFTETCFVTGGSGRQLAAALKKGMRAVTIALPSHCALEGVLYPGCLVDVIASVKHAAKGEKEDWTSLPILQRIQVLTVGDQTVFTQEEESPAPKARSGRSKTMVTLMVDPDQASILQLASELGELALTMRNPFDEVALDTTPLLASNLFAAVYQKEQQAETAQAIVPPEAPPPFFAIETRPQPLVEALPPPPMPQWQVEVIRAGKVEKHTFDKAPSFGVIGRSALDKQ